MEALEERGTQAVVDRDLAIEALKKELEMVEAEKTRPAGEVAGLHASQVNFDDLKKKVESLNRALDGTKVAE